MKKILKIFKKKEFYIYVALMLASVALVILAFCLCKYFNASIQITFGVGYAVAIVAEIIMSKAFDIAERGKENLDSV